MIFAFAWSLDSEHAVGRPPGQVLALDIVAAGLETAILLRHFAGFF